MSTIEEAVSAVSVTRELGKPVLVGVTLHDEPIGKLRSGECLEDAIDALGKFNPAGILANYSLPERIRGVMPMLVSSGFSCKGGYTKGFCSIPRDWLLDGDKDSDGKLEFREDLSHKRYR